METVAESAGTWRVAGRCAGTNTGKGVPSEWTCTMELGTPSEATLDAGKATTVNRRDIPDDI